MAQADVDVISSPEQLSRMQSEMQKFSGQYQEHSKQLQKLGQPRIVLQTQLHESEEVLKELNLMENSTSLYKNVGPLLIKQDLDEAKSNVNNRLGLIREQIDRANQQYDEIEKLRDECRNKVMRIQNSLQNFLDTHKENK